VHVGGAFALMTCAAVLLFTVCVKLMDRGSGIRE